MRVLIIDNYDSFTYNLYQSVGGLLGEHYDNSDFDVIVKRNNEITLDQIKSLKPDRIIVSPGPGTPEDSSYFGVCSKVILELTSGTPLLGVCLGMQGIAHCFGGRIVRASLPMHGKISLIKHDGKGVYKGIPQLVEVMRYHSLIVDTETLPACFDITSVVISNPEKGDAGIGELVSGGGEIMGIRHKEYPIEGVRYHPESFATEGGKKLLQNFLFSH